MNFAGIKADCGDEDISNPGKTHHPKTTLPNKFFNGSE
jgi:hypothetical protein